MKRIALLCLLAIGCAKARPPLPGTSGPKIGLAASGNGPTFGTVDLLPTAAVVSDPGMVRLANVAGGLQASTNGGAFAAIGGGGAQSTMTVVLARAQALLGSQYASIGGSDFYLSGDFVTTGSSGSFSAALTTTDRSGVIAVATGATSFSFASVKLAGIGSQIDNLLTSKWYAAWRAAFIAVSGAATARLRMLGTTNAGFDIGAFESISGVDFSVQVIDPSGATKLSAATAVALDTNYHTFEEWNDGTSLKLAIDGAVVGTVAISSMSGSESGRMNIAASNASTAANMQINCDYVWIVTAPN